MLVELRPAEGGGLEELFLSLTSGAAAGRRTPGSPRAAIARRPPFAGAPLAERPSLLRLTRVELRKTVDTRAGIWLLGSSPCSPSRSR